MSIIKYQNPFGTDDKQFFIFNNEPVYWTAYSDSGLTVDNMTYVMNIYKNKETGSVPELLSTSNIYPHVEEGLMVYNPISILKAELGDAYFHPDEFIYHYPDTIRNVRVDVIEYGEGITHTGETLVIDEYKIKDEELEVGKLYQIQIVGRIGPADFSNYTDITTGLPFPNPLTRADVGGQFIPTSGNTQPNDWGGTYVLSYSAGTEDLPGGETYSFDKGIVIRGFDYMTLGENEIDGTYPLDYLLTTSSPGKLFSKQEGFVNKLNINERSTLRAFNGKMYYGNNDYISTLENVRFEVTNADGSKRRYIISDDNYQSTWSTDTSRYLTGNTSLQNLTGMIVDLPVGPYNLRNLPAIGKSFTQIQYWNGTSWVNSVATGINPQDIIVAGASYKVTTYSTTSSLPTSEEYEFEVTCDNKYTPVMLTWENELGGWDSYSFKMVSSNVETTSKNSFEKKQDKLGDNLNNLNNISYIGRKQTSRGLTVYSSESNETVNINSDWLSDAELAFLRDLFKSHNVYMLDEEKYSQGTNKNGNNPLGLGRWYSVILDDDSITYKTNKRGLRQINLTLVKNTTKK